MITSGSEKTARIGTRSVPTIVLLPLFFLYWAYGGQARPGLRVGRESNHTVFEVMEEVARLESLPLWPGFVPHAVPTALFDGKSTYLFNYPHKPEGFLPLEGRPDAYILDGRHLAVFGNRRTMLENVWIATSILNANTSATGRPFTTREIAALVLHEQFHVFQAFRHPDWLPNDLALFDYPLDSVESLRLRIAEVEGFSRAVIAGGRNDAAGWAAAALEIRRKRLSGLPVKHARYESELQRLEGTAEYVEYLGGGRGVMDGPRAAGIAPRAARELGYQEGRWLAVLLDRLDPGWKDAWESGEFEYLEDRLKNAVREFSGLKSFTPAELQAMAAEAERSLRKSEEERIKLSRTVKSTIGNKIEIVAVNRPLKLQNFDPFNIEALNETEMLHKEWLVLKNERGAVEVFHQPCLTEINQDSQIIRLTIPGLFSRIRAFRRGGKVTAKMEGITAVFEGARLSWRGKNIVIKLE